MSSTLAMSMSYIQPSAVTHSKQDAFQLAYPNTVPTPQRGMGTKFNSSDRQVTGEVYDRVLKMCITLREN